MPRLCGLIKQLTAAEQLLKEVTPIDDGECGGLRIELSRQHLHLGGGQKLLQSNHSSLILRLGYVHALQERSLLAW